MPKYEALFPKIAGLLGQALDGGKLDAQVILQTLYKKPIGGSGKDALVQGMRNDHVVDEFWVASAVAKHFAAHIGGTSVDALVDQIPRLVSQVEPIKIPLPPDTEL